MANVRNGNTYYIDSASVSLDIESLKVWSITLSGVGGAAILELADDNSAASYPSKIYIPAASAAVTHLIYDPPLFFPNGIRVVTATNAKATLVIEGPGA